MYARLSRLFKRLLIATAIAVLVALAPLPVWTPRWFAYVQVPTVVFFLVCYTGKLLLDTFFYDRYP